MVLWDLPTTEIPGEPQLSSLLLETIRINQNSVAAIAETTKYIPRITWHILLPYSNVVYRKV